MLAADNSKNSHHSYSHHHCNNKSSKCCSHHKYGSCNRIDKIHNDLVLTIRAQQLGAEGFMRLGLRV